MGDEWITKQLQQFAEQFDEADTNKSGTISFRELGFSLVKAGYKGSFKDTMTIFKNMDADGDKMISRQEYLDRMKTVPPREIKEMSMRREFKLMDTDGSGTLSRQEIYDSLCNSKLDPAAENLANLIEALDSDPEKKLDYERFLTAWNGQQDSR